MRLIYAKAERTAGGCASALIRLRYHADKESEYVKSGQADADAIMLMEELEGVRICEFKETLRTIREERGLDRKAMADVMGANYCTYCCWERGRTYPAGAKGKEAVRRLAEFSGYDAESLWAAARTQSLAVRKPMEKGK